MTIFTLLTSIQAVFVFMMSMIIFFGFFFVTRYRDCTEVCKQGFGVLMEKYCMCLVQVYFIFNNYMFNITYFTCG